MRRRDVLILAGAAAAGPALTRAAAREAVIYDSRFPEAECLGQAAQRSGAVALDVHREDIARLWRGPVSAALKRGRAAKVSGLTTWADFQVAAGFAHEARLRPVRHMFTKDRTLVSWSIG